MRYLMRDLIVSRYEKKCVNLLPATSQVVSHQRRRQRIIRNAVVRRVDQFWGQSAHDGEFLKVVVAL